MDKRELLIKLEQIRNEERESCIFGAGIVGRNYGLELLKKRDIKPSFYCDSNAELWGMEIKEGIKCISLEEFKKKNPVCFIMVSAHLRDEVYILVKQLGITDIVLYDELCELEIDSYFEFRNRKQIAVYTCILNNYDEVQEPEFISDKCDYYLISDKKPREGSIYKFIDIADCNIHNVKDFTRKNRYCKLKAHEIFPEYRYSIYFDGNIKLVSESILNKIYELSKSRIMAYGKNAFDCIFMEAMRAGEHFRDSKEVINKQVEKYWLEGMPENFGSFFCGVLIREHNNPICVKLMNEWWNEIERYSRKDQISFPYVLWKNGFTKNDVKVLEDDLQNLKYVDWNKQHKKPRV